MSFTVAIIGRPNVGKSTLFNRLVGFEQAIVEPTAGVTRDRNYGTATWQNKSFLVVDTGGIEHTDEDDFQRDIHMQVDFAIAEASLILFLVDASDGLIDADKEIAKMMRRKKIPVVLVCNKIDTPDKEFLMNEFYALGFKGQLFPVSAINGYGTGELLEFVASQAPASEEEESEDQRLVHIAIVGKPNVGKSSLLNVLTEQNRSVVSEVSGTTRDSINTEYRAFGKHIILVDTAGIRRRKQIANDIEFYSTIRTIKAIKSSDVCLLLIDAADGITGQDLAIFKEIEDSNKGVVILVNKWDLVEKDHKSTDKFSAAIREKLAPFSDVPIFFTSNVTRQRLLKSVEKAVQIAENRKKKIPTSKLNEVMLPIITNFPPPVYKSKDIRIKFVTQLPTKSPAIAFFCNLPQYVKEPYKRFLENKLRENFDFSGIPVRLYFRQK